MEHRTDSGRARAAWWALGLVAVVTGLVVMCSLIFAGTFISSVPVTVTSQRSGLVMETGSKVKLRGVEVGRVANVRGDQQAATLTLDIFPDDATKIPSNVEVEIKASTAFGAKYVDLILPDNPSPQSLRANSVLQAKNVSTEVNTVFQNLVDIVGEVDVPKLNATLTALSDGFRDQGDQMGEALTSANQVLEVVNPRMDHMRDNWRAFGEFNDAYGAAANNIIDTLDAASTTSATITSNADQLDLLLLNAIGFSNAGINLIGPNLDNLIQGVNELAPTTELLHKYDPSYTCLLMGAKWFIDKSASSFGGNGKSIILDAALNLGEDTYRYPNNLPIVAAKGGPGGKPGCGSLPDASKNFPVRQLITNTGWGTGLDLRPNPGIGHPFYGNYLPKTRGIPEPPSIRGVGPPAVGPPPAYFGGPPYGTPQYGPDGAPLYPPPPGFPPVPPAPVPAPTPPPAEVVPNPPAPPQP